MTGRGGTAFLTVPGPPIGKGRPRFTKTGRVFTDAKTIAAEGAVKRAWLAAGEPRFFDAPLAVEILLLVPRPKSHLRKNARLSAAGLREPHCMRKPDLDNVAKLVLDALNGLAYRDDAQVVQLHISRRWSEVPEGATAIQIRAVR